MISLLSLAHFLCELSSHLLFKLWKTFPLSPLMHYFYIFKLIFKGSSMKLMGLLMIFPCICQYTFLSSLPSCPSLLPHRLLLIPFSQEPKSSNQQVDQWAEQIVLTNKWSQAHIRGYACACVWVVLNWYLVSFWISPHFLFWGRVTHRIWIDTWKSIQFP